MRKVSSQVILTICFLLIIAGCGIRNMDGQEEQEVDYTVIKEADIPEEVAKVVQKKKAEPFQMTYQSGDFLYILRGYGIQNSGGYSIQVKKMAATQDAIYVGTELVGPPKKIEQDSVSYPFIVIKIKYQNLPVIFE